MQKKIYLTIFLLVIAFLSTSSILLYNDFPTILLIEGIIAIGVGIAIFIIGVIRGVRIPLGHGVPPSNEDAPWPKLAGTILIAFGIISILIEIIIPLL